MSPIVSPEVIGEKIQLHKNETSAISLLAKTRDEGSLQVIVGVEGEKSGLRSLVVDTQGSSGRVGDTVGREEIEEGEQQGQNGLYESRLRKPRRTPWFLLSPTTEGEKVISTRVPVGRRGVTHQSL